MSKRFSTLETVKVLLEHHEVLSQAIRRMDEKAERAIREAELALQLHAYIRPLDDTETQRVKIAFATDNLFQCNVLADVEKRDGERLLVFQESLVALFRLFDASLYQELTDAKLRSKLGSLRDAYSRLDSAACSFNEQDPNYTELVEDLFEQLSHLLGLLRTNVSRMQRLSADLEALSSDACKNQADFSEFRDNLLDKVSHLFERHIKPTLSFVNHKIKLKDGANLFETLNDIKLKFDANGKAELADQSFRFALSFSNIFRPIQLVARQVDQFIRKTRKGMTQYNAMEYFYQRLKQDYGKTLEKQINKTRIDGRDFARYTGFSLGLKQQARLTCYRFGDSPDYYHNLIAEIQIRIEELRHEDALPGLVGEAQRDERGMKRLERAQTMYEYLANMPLRPTEDLAVMLHYRLETRLEGYMFSDLLAALIHFSRTGTRAGYKIETTNRKAYLIDRKGAGVYVYRRKRLVLDSNEEG